MIYNKEIVLCNFVIIIFMCYLLAFLMKNFPERKQNVSTIWIKVVVNSYWIFSSSYYIPRNFCSLKYNIKKILRRKVVVINKFLVLHDFSITNYIFSKLWNLNNSHFYWYTGKLVLVLSKLWFCIFVLDIQMIFSKKKDKYFFNI